MLFSESIFRKFSVQRDPSAEGIRNYHGRAENTVPTENFDCDSVRAEGSGRGSVRDSVRGSEERGLWGTFRISRRLGNDRERVLRADTEQGSKEDTL